MAIVTNTIGTAGRDFSTIALWEASLPANAVTAGNSYVGQCFNDSEFSVAGTVVTFSGTTTDATHTITLTTGSGQSFRDAAGVQTNALNYNATNGVGLRCTAAGGATIDIQEDYVFLNELQAQYDGTFTTTRGAIKTSANHGPYISSCIFKNSDTNAETQVATISNNTSDCAQFLNCLFLQAATVYLKSVVLLGSGGIFANCTLIGASTGVVSGFQTGGQSYNAATHIVNCAGFGSNAFIDTTTVGQAGLNGSNNASDKAIGFGTSNQASVTFASQFQNTTFASGDYRAKTGGALIDTGATDTTDIPSATDIVGTSRPQGSAWDIGAWELVVATDVLMAQAWM